MSEDADKARALASRELPLLPPLGDVGTMEADMARSSNDDRTPKQGTQHPGGKPRQGGSPDSQPSSSQIGAKSADQSDAERGGMGTTEGQPGSEGGLGSAARNASQERSRGGQMGPGGSR